MYKIIALMGEAGTGKDTLMQYILSQTSDLHEIVNCTTRPMREGEVDGVNYFFMSPEDFGIKVLHYEMLECTVFNDWFYGTSFESVRSDCVNIGVFSPMAIESLMERLDVDVRAYRVCATPKTRLLRQLNREGEPNVDEIVRRYSADKSDFMDLDFPYQEVINEEGSDLHFAAMRILADAEQWAASGQK